MRTRTVVLGLVMLGMLPGCAQPTPYQPAVAGYGYSEQQIEDDRYRVSFAGNELTPADTVQNYLLYRAAELTLDHGFDYFSVVDRDLDRSTIYWGTAGPGLGTGYVRRRGDFVGGLGFATYSARPIDSYTAYADVVMFEGAKPAGDVNAYDARSVLRQPDVFLSGHGQGPNFVPAAGVVSDAPQHTFFRRLVQGGSCRAPSPVYARVWSRSPQTCWRRRQVRQRGTCMMGWLSLCR